MDFRLPRGTSLGNQVMTESEVSEFLSRQSLCILSFFNVNRYPGILPMNTAWDGERFYFHWSTRPGERSESIAANARVGICLYQPAADASMQDISTHLSVVAYGEIEQLAGEEAVSALQKLAVAADMPFKADPERIRGFLHRTAVFAVRPQHMVGRHVRFVSRPRV